MNKEENQLISVSTSKEHPDGEDVREDSNKGLLGLELPYHHSILTPINHRPCLSF